MKVIHFKFPDSSRTRVGSVSLKWLPNKTLKLYLHHPVVKPHGLINLSMRCYIYKEDGNKVRLPYTPQAGETFTFVPAKW